MKKLQFLHHPPEAIILLLLLSLFANLFPDVHIHNYENMLLKLHFKITNINKFPLSVEN